MEKNKKTNMLTVFLIISIVIIIIMGYNIYKLSTIEQDTTKEITLLKKQNQTLQKALNDIQNTLNTLNDSIAEESKTDKELAEETAKKFITAVNQKDWKTVEKLSSSGIVSSLQKYNISNMKIDDYSDYEEENGSYFYHVTYDMEYEGSTNLKDFSLGRLFTVKKVDGNFIVISPFATGK